MIDIKMMILFIIKDLKTKKLLNAINKKKIDRKIKSFKKCGINKKNRKQKLIVSLTSFPERIYDIHYALYSLLTQTLKPDKVILWLGEEQFPNKEKDLSKEVLELKKNGLIIKWCKDIKSYKKLIPSLIEYPNDIIVTADDDIFYDENWLKTLYKSYLKNKNYVHCQRAHKIKFNEHKELLSYDEWEKSIQDNSASFLNFFTGAGGVLYPPNVLYKDILNEELFKKMAPNNDDIWFWAMCVLNGTKIKVVKNNFCDLIFINPERETSSSNEFTLFKINVILKKNYSQIEKTLKEFPQIKERIINEYEKLKNKK